MKDRPDRPRRTKRAAKPPLALSPNMPVAEAARAVLGARLREVARLLPRVLRPKAGSEDSVKSVHALRVATRRAGAALEVFKPLVRPKNARRLRRRLRAIRRAAGIARDLDVQRATLARMVKTLDDRDQRAALRELLILAKRARREAAEPLRALAERWPGRTLRERLDRATARVGGGPRADAFGAGATLLDAARAVIEGEIERVEAAACADLTDLDCVHAMRIELKRLRYGMEVFAPCFGAAWRDDLYPRLSDIQGAMGELNDAYVLHTTLARHEPAPPPPTPRRKPAGRGRRSKTAAVNPDPGVGLRSLLQTQAERLAAAHDAFLERWRAFDSRAFFAGVRAQLTVPAAAAAAPAAADLATLLEPKPALNGSAAASRKGARPGRRRIAAIDVGTNSVRLIVAETQADGSYRVLDDEKEVTRLGRGLAETGRMDPAAIEHTGATIARMKAIAAGYGARELRIVGTSAAREASNGNDLERTIRESCGLRLEVITGEEEAILAYRSAARAFDLASAPGLVVDIGGGSTEIVLSGPAGPGASAAGVASRPTALGGGVIDRVYTLPLGAVRLTEMFGGPEECARDRFDELKRHIRKTLKAAVGEPPTIPQTVIGTGGSLTTLAAMALTREAGPTADGLFGGSVQGYEVTRADLKHLLDYLRKLPVRDRARVPGLSADRADIIVAGLAVLDGVLKRFGANRLRVHEGGIRDGILLTMAQAGGPPSAEGGEAGVGRDPMKGVRRFAKACNYEAAHAKHVTSLALEIFDQLAEHAQELPLEAGMGFSAEARLLLEAATLLHDVGYLINYARHHKHSYHLIIHADLPGLTTRQVRVIANVARYHRAAEPKLKHRNFAALAAEDRALVRQLAAILRVADGLDRTHVQSVLGVRVKLEKGAAHFGVSAEEEPTVDMWGAVRKSALFNGVFGRLAHFEWAPGVAPRREARDVSRTGSGQEPVATQIR